MNGEHEAEREYLRAEHESLWAAVRELLDGPRGIVRGDDHGNPVCVVCGSHLDGEYGHREGYDCETVAALMGPA